MRWPWSQRGDGFLVACSLVMLVLHGTASAQQTVNVDCPFNTVAAGVQAVDPGGEVVITGACPEALTIDKPLTLKTQGPNAVMIGPDVASGTPDNPVPDEPLIYYLAAEWSDPFTPPQSRTTCIGWFKWGLIKTCSEWKTEWRHMMNRLYIEIDGGGLSIQVEQVQQCFQQAIVSGLVYGIGVAAITGGAGLPAAQVAFLENFSRCVLLDLFNVSFPTWSGWSDWG